MLFRSLHGPFTSISKDTFEIRDIVFSGSDPEDETKILKQCKLSENSLITKTQIKNAVSTFYATMAYTGVTYKLIEVGNGVYDLHFTLEEKNEKTFNLGLRVDTEEFVAVLANGVFGLNTRKKSQLDAMVRFGDRTYAGLNYVIEPWMMMKINVGYLFKYDDFDLYRKGHKYSNYTSMQQLVEIGFSDVWKHKLLFRCGGRYLSVPFHSTKIYRS